MLRSYGRCMGSSRLQGGRAATVRCGDGSNFLSADQHDAGRLNRPIAGMVSIPIGRSGLPPPTGGHPDPKSDEQRERGGAFR